LAPNDVQLFKDYSLNKKETKQTHVKQNSLLLDCQQAAVKKMPSSE